GTGREAVRPTSGLRKWSRLSCRSRGAHRGRDLAEALGGDHEGALRQLLFVDPVGEQPRQRHGQDLFNVALELESYLLMRKWPGNGLTRGKMLRSEGRPPGRPPGSSGG